MRRQWFLNTRQLMLAVAGGVASAAIGKVLGRAVHLAVPIPMSGSLVAALPRAVILLVVAARVRRCGALTVAGLAEAAVALVLGGMFPLSLLAPLAAGVGADAVWLVTRPVPAERLRLMLAGAALCSVRVLMALVLLTVVRMPIGKVMEAAPILLWGIIAANALLGAGAGLLAAGIVKELRQAGVME